MTTMEFLLLFAGSGGWLVAIIKLIGEALAAKRARKEKLEDQALEDQKEQEDKKDSLEKQFKEFAKLQEERYEEQKKQNASVRQRLEGVESAVALNTEVNIAGEYIAIRKEACAYIKAGSIDPVDRAELKARYARYLKLSKKKEDSSLTNIIAELDKLRSEPFTFERKGD